MLSLPNLSNSVNFSYVDGDLWVASKQDKMKQAFLPRERSGRERRAPDRQKEGYMRGYFEGVRAIYFLNVCSNMLYDIMGEAGCQEFLELTF